MTDWRRIAGRTLMVGFDGPEPGSLTVDRLRALDPAGIILFARNLESPEQTAGLVERLRDTLATPALFAIDQEGGRVSRLRRFVGPTPGAAHLSPSGPESVARFAGATARALSSLGFNLDFAPVADLCDPDATNGIGDRSFGSDPEHACSLAGAFLDGLQGAGVAGCLKHFPGLGATRVDSHFELPVDSRPPQELDVADLVPYRALGPRAATVMVAHAHYPGLDPTSGRPASLSPVIVDGLLRGDIGYAGCVVSDDLEMGAVAPLDVDGTAAVLAVRAGCDLLLYCSDLGLAERAMEALAVAATEDRGFATRLEEAAASVERLARRWPAPPTNLSAWEDARRELAETWAESEA